MTCIMICISCTVAAAKDTLDYIGFVAPPQGHANNARNATRALVTTEKGSKQKSKQQNNNNNNNNNKKRKEVVKDGNKLLAHFMLSLIHI